MNKNIKNNSAKKIQNNAIKMFYKKYGIYWQEMVQNFDEYLDYYCYRNDIVDPITDYINYYR